MAQTYAKSRVKVRNVEEIASTTEWMTKKYDLVVLDDGIFLKSVIGGLGKGAFLMMKVTRGIYTRDQIREKVEPKHFLVAHKFDDDYDIFLIRKVRNYVLRRDKLRFKTLFQIEHPTKMQAS
jgi:hypothetical protein